MKITLICNCGLAFESGGQTLLLDALTQELPPFYRAPETVRQDIIYGTGEYQNVCGLLFTHLHPDHFSVDMTLQYLHRHPVPVVMMPHDPSAMC